jgi:hypothetical protein
MDCGVLGRHWSKRSGMVGDLLSAGGPLWVHNPEDLQHTGLRQAGVCPGPFAECTGGEIRATIRAFTSARNKGDTQANRHTDTQTRERLDIQKHRNNKHTDSNADATTDTDTHCTFGAMVLLLLLLILFSEFENLNNCCSGS